MTTPVQRHQQRVRAGLASAAAPHGTTVQGSAYQLMQAQLYEHKRRLHDIKSVERKIEAKAQFVGIYDPWIDGVLAEGQGAQDQVFTTLLVWNIDVGNYERALTMADYALQHKLAMPDKYERDLSTVLVDEFATAALSGKLPADEAMRLLGGVTHLTDEDDIHDQARAKLYKAIGYALIGKTPTQDADFTALSLSQAQAAMQSLKRAFELFEGVGVKKDIERLERRLKDLQPPAS